MKKILGNLVPAVLLIMVGYSLRGFMDKHYQETSVPTTQVEKPCPLSTALSAETAKNLPVEEYVPAEDAEELYRQADKIGMDIQRTNKLGQKLNPDDHRIYKSLGLAMLAHNAAYHQGNRGLLTFLVGN